MKKLMSLMAVTLMLIIFAGCGHSVDPPSGLKVVSKLPVTLSWNALSWATGYNVYRGTTSGSLSTKTLIAANFSGVACQDTTALPGHTYYYQVVAVNSYGASDASNEVSVSSGTFSGGSIQGHTLSLSRTVSTFAGFHNYSGSTDGTADVARFRCPESITTDGTNIYVADMRNQTIRKIVISTGEVSTIAGKAGVIGSADGTKETASFKRPIGITTDGTNLYVADNISCTIRKIELSTGIVTTIAGKDDGLPQYLDGPGDVARFLDPVGITTDGTNLYVTEYTKGIIRKINISSRVVTTVADVKGAAAIMNGPVGITTDGTNLYVVEFDGGTICKFVIATGVGERLTGTFNKPSGIATDGASLYVVESRAGIITKADLATGAVVSTVAGMAGYFGSTEGIGAYATFYEPTGVTTDGTSLFVADSLNHTIRRIQ